MNNRQLKQVRMFIRMRLFFAKSKLAFTTFLPLVQLITNFLLLLTGLENEINAQDLDATGIAKGKEDKRLLMIKLIVPLARKGKVYAGTIPNKDLETQLNIRKTDFGVSEIMDLAIAENAMKIINANAVSLVAYNITALQLTAGNDALKDFKDSVEKPEEAGTANKAATENIAKDITLCSAILADIDDLLISEYEETIATMVSEYKINRKIGTAAKQHTAVTVHVYGDAAHSTPILGAMMEIVELGRITATDSDGMAEVIQFTGGNYTLRIKAKGKVNYELPFTIKSGKKIELDIILVPNVIYGIVKNNGKLALGQPVSIENTSLQVMTDNFGSFKMPDVPDGHGVIKTSTPGGDSVSIPYEMVNGENLNIDLNVV